MSRCVVLAAASWLALALGTAVPAADVPKAPQAPPAKKHVPLPAFNDPATAGPDFPFQGEYCGTVEASDGPAKYGVQVIARDHGKFHCVAYRGGLPGDGWDRGEKIEADGQLQEGVVTFAVPGNDKATASLASDMLTVKDGSGKVLGTLAKLSRQSPTLGAKPPAGAVVLFDGTSADQWNKGEMTPDHLLVQGAVSKRQFGDTTYHLEFRLPFMPSGTGQARANSGFYVQGRYEIQILDSFGLPGLDNECGGIYHAAKPAVNMCYPPLSWQTYDVVFTAPRFRGGEKVENARITVRHNGVIVQDNLTLAGPTPGGVIKGEGETGPIYLQNHGGDPVRFRNIWVLEKK
jgi:hypothetical protein